MPANNLKILFIGDIEGALGRQGVKEILPRWQKKYQPDLIIANIENLAHGKGLTSKTVADISGIGIDVFTGGNHTWRKQDLSDFTDLKIATPLNDVRTLPVHRYQEISLGGQKIAIINLLGQSLMNSDTINNPFLAIQELLPNLASDIIIVDMHAELTSEKRAMGFFLAGKVAAVIGTHTHVPTADAQILPPGTAYITDVGMAGSFSSVLGIKKEVIIEKFLTGSHIRHELPEAGQIEINAVLLSIDRQSKNANDIKLLREIISAPSGN
ncbi:MAG: TIGR00282 family metallophosphoesterase [Patescibacteria group bacterium]